MTAFTHTPLSSKRPDSILMEVGGGEKIEALNELEMRHVQKGPLKSLDSSASSEPQIWFKNL